MLQHANGERSKRYPTPYNSDTIQTGDNLPVVMF